MADNKRKFDLILGTSYDGAGVKNAAADIAKLRKELSLPAMGPLTKSQAQAEVEGIRRREDRAAYERALGKRNAIGDALNKFGISNDAGGVLEKLGKVSGAIGPALAITKAASFAAEYYNFREDVKRHAEQGNLERQLADEQRANQFKASVPILGHAAVAFADRFNLNNYHKDRVAIENAEDATKQTDLQTAAMERRNKVEKDLRENGQTNADALTLGYRKSKTTAERGNFLDAQESQRLFERKIANLPTDVDPKRIAEVGAERAARSLVTLDALKGSILGDVGRTGDFLSTFVSRMGEIVKGNVEKLSEARDLNFEAADIRLRTAGDGYKADIAKIKFDRDKALADEKDVAKRVAINAVADAKIASRDHARARDFDRIDANIGEIRDRTAGLNFKAGIDRIRADTAEALKAEKDPAMRARIALRKARPRSPAISITVPSIVAGGSRVASIAGH
jgi:hypothetical protein